MVQTSVILAFIFNIVISFGLPLGVFALILYKWRRAAIRPVLVGVLVFLIMQMALRIPLVMFVLPRTPAFWHIMLYPVSYGLFLGFTAGLAEELGRWLGYRTLLCKRDDWRTGFSLGVGHAGIESMILVGMMSINDLMHALRINRGFFGMFVNGMEQRLLARINIYLTNLDPWVVMLEGVERISVFAIQIAFSLMVLYGIKTKQAGLWLVIAIFAHTLVDAPVVILPKIMDFSIYKIELFLGVCALIALWFILKSRKMFANATIK